MRKYYCTVALACAVAVGCGCGKKEEPEAKEAPKKEAPRVASPAEKEAERREMRRRPGELSEAELDSLIAEVGSNLKQGAPLAKAGAPNPLTMLGRSRSPKAVPVLKDVLTTSKDSLSRRLAAQALGMIRSPEASEALMPGLKDENMWVRLTAAMSLARLGEKEEPLPIFAEVIKRKGIESWKIEMGAEPSRPQPPGQGERVKEQTLPILALSGLSMINTPESAEIVKEAAKSKNPYVRRKAERILGRFGGKGEQAGKGK